MFVDAAVDDELVFDNGLETSYTTVGDNIAQKDAANGIIDVGRDVGSATQNADRFPAIVLNVNVTSQDLTTTDETYFARIDWSDDNTFATILAASPNIPLVVGANPTVTEVLGRFARLVYVLAGTTPILVVEQGYLSFQTQ